MSHTTRSEDEYEQLARIVYHIPPDCMVTAQDRQSAKALVLFCQYNGLNLREHLDWFESKKEIE